MNALKLFLDKNGVSNFLWAVDSHSCYQSVGLVHGQGANDVSLIAPVDQVRIYYTEISVSCFKYYLDIRKVH